jgi:transposase, IS6 family
MWVTGGHRTPQHTSTTGSGPVRPQSTHRPQTGNATFSGIAACFPLLRLPPACHPLARSLGSDKNAAYPKAFNELKAAGIISKSCELGQVKYLNTLIEQDHRFIKRLTKPGMGFFSFETAWQTLQGFEVMNMMRKGQVQEVAKGNISKQITFIASLFGVAI